MKRMLSFISDQRMPNFIPLNEPKTRPDAVHFVYTPAVERMQRCLDELCAALKHAVPQVEVCPVTIEDPYNMRSIRELCNSLLAQYPEDEWSLNATGGTKLMSAPAMELFHSRNLPALYVDTSNQRTLQIQPDWSFECRKFENTIGLEAYFALFGIRVVKGESQNTKEDAHCNSLRKLDWAVYPNVHLYSDNLLVNECDAICIKSYQLTQFELKSRDVKRKADNNKIWHCLLKRAHIQKHYGGPFGKTYWALSGKQNLSAENLARIHEYGIILLNGRELNDLAKHPEKYGLPAIKTHAEPA